MQCKRNSYTPTTVFKLQVYCNPVHVNYCNGQKELCYQFSDEVPWRPLTDDGSRAVTTMGVCLLREARDARMRCMSMDDRTS
jgi:hypothetical protein